MLMFRLIASKIYPQIFNEYNELCDRHQRLMDDYCELIDGKKEIKNAYFSKKEHLSNMFSHIWSTLSKAEQDALLKLYHNENASFSQKINDFQVELPCLEPTLKKLEKKGLVVQNGPSELSCTVYCLPEYIARGIDLMLDKPGLFI